MNKKFFAVFFIFSHRWCFYTYSAIWMKGHIRICQAQIKILFSVIFHLIATRRRSLMIFNNARPWGWYFFLFNLSFILKTVSWRRSLITWLGFFRRSFSAKSIRHSSMCKQSAPDKTEKKKPWNFYRYIAYTHAGRRILKLKNLINNCISGETIL